MPPTSSESGASAPSRAANPHRWSANPRRWSANPHRWSANPRWCFPPALRLRRVTAANGTFPARRRTPYRTRIVGFTTLNDKESEHVHAQNVGPAAWGAGQLCGLSVMYTLVLFIVYTLCERLELAGGACWRSHCCCGSLGLGCCSCWPWICCVLCVPLCSVDSFLSRGMHMHTCVR